jgi:hypothetical protein
LRYGPGGFGSGVGRNVPALGICSNGGKNVLPEDNDHDRNDGNGDDRNDRNKIDSNRFKSRVDS